MSKKEKIPFRVKMKDGSIETIPAYSEKQALFLASRMGRKPLRVVGILSENMAVEESEKKKEENLEKLLARLEEAIGKEKYLEALKIQVEIHRAVSEGRISWSNELEKKYKLFYYRL